jgi:hypothetical protein
MTTIRIPKTDAVRVLTRLRNVLVIVVISAVVVACTGDASRDNSAANLMPNLSGYTVTNTVDIQDSIAKVLGTTSLGAGQPQVTALIAATNEIVKCYQQAGALEGRVYVKTAEPIKAGVVVIINKNQALNPGVFLNCVGVPGLTAPQGTLQPCANAYTLKRDNNEFFIGYAATDGEVCSAFCSTLQGCTPQ